MGHQIDERTNKRLSKAYEQLGAEEYLAARKTLDRMRLRSLNPLERAKVHQIYAFLGYGEGDLEAARESLEKAIAEDALPATVQSEMRFQIAQLYLAEENWSGVVTNLDKWFARVEAPNAAAYYMLAIAHYQLDDVDAALVPALQAVAQSNEPREPWLQLLLALHLTRKDYEEAVPLLEQLAKHFPKKSYWLQLSTVHGALGNYEDALVPLQFAYAQNLLTTDEELRRLAQLLLYLDLPFRAAGVLSLGLEHERIDEDVEVYQLLGNSWIAAREYENAVAPLAQAAKLATTGDLYMRLAQVHIQRERWAEATIALEQALEKGGLADEGDVYLLMGIAHYSQKRPGHATRWFRRALEHSNSRKEAESWLSYIHRELTSG
jgi:tetratricopeptide (TPR) repeat protein